MLVHAIAIVLSLSDAAPEPAHLKLRPVPYTQVEIDDGFWSPRLETNRTKTLPYLLEMFEKDGTVGNFDKASGRVKGEHQMHPFMDGLFFACLQGAAETLQKRRDPDLEAKLDGLIERIVAAQEKDGYLHTSQQLREPGKRWQYEKGTHELYDAGQLIEAGIAYFQATGKRALLDAAVRFADLIDREFGPGKKSIISDHAEPEQALVKLYRLTGEERYLGLARYLVDEHGRATGGRKLLDAYAQDDRPFVEQDRPVGHAVRAMLFYTGAADVAAFTGDQGYLGALGKIWRSMIERRMYITGGVGSAAEWEGFGPDYELPNETGYLETCASVTGVYFANRMNLLTGDARAVDAIERVLYNGIPVAVSLDGVRFFYENPLLVRTPRERWAWHSCPCCPPNILKFYSSLGSYLYAQDGGGIYVNLFMGSRAEVDLKRLKVKLRQETRYPWDGGVKVTVEPERAAKFSLNIRRPEWCEALSLKLNGQEAPAPESRRGYLSLEREWKAGDTVVLDLEMPVRRVYSNPVVKANLGRVAIQRGPLVYCLEGIDNGRHVLNLALSPEAMLTAEHRTELLGGVTVVKGAGLARGLADPDERLYRGGPAKLRPVEVLAVPYCVWDNRQPGEMAVWIPEVPFLAEPVLAVSASHSWEHDTVLGLLHAQDPTHSNDQAARRFSLWPHKGTTEWVQRDFERPRRVAGVEVYWYDDGPENNAAVGGKVLGGCRPPRAWKVLYREGEAWKPVSGAKEYGVALNRYNEVSFEPVETPSIRIEMELQKDFTAGVLGWRIR